MLAKLKRRLLFVPHHAAVEAFVNERTVTILREILIAGVYSVAKPERNLE